MAQKVIIISYVIARIIQPRGQHKRNSARRKIADVSPYIRSYVQAHIRPIKAHRFLISSVVDRYIEASACGNYQLFKALVGMSATVFAAGNIIQVIKPLYRKRYVNIILDRSNTTGRIIDLRKMNNVAIKNSRLAHSLVFSKKSETGLFFVVIETPAFVFLASSLRRISFIGKPVCNTPSPHHYPILLNKLLRQFYY
jgi:hypothetical protein